MAQYFGSPYIPEHFVSNPILGFRQILSELNFGTAWRSNCRHRTKLIGCTWWAVRYLLLTISIKADSYALLFPDQISRPWSYHIISKSNSLFLFYFIFWVSSSYHGFNSISHVGSHTGSNTKGLRSVIMSKVDLLNLPKMKKNWLFWCWLLYRVLFWLVCPKND